MISSSRLSQSIVPCKKNMASQNCKQSSFSQFHETVEQLAFNKVVHELQWRQRRDVSLSSSSSTSSSSSSLSSLSTSSLFSLSDSMSQPKRYKTTGILFGNLDPVPLDPKIDPKPYACYNCWQYDHECHGCPEVKILYCRNCGRRGVVMNECPRCAKAYMAFLDRLNGRCRAFFGGVQEPEEKTKSIQDVKLDVIEEEGTNEECWDDVVEKDHKSYGADFPDSLEKKEAGYRYDDSDWDNYQSPRVNMIEKTSKVYSLFATKEKVEKIKNDNWDNFAVDNYSYSLGNNVNANNSTSFIFPEENTKDKDENWNSLSQDASKDLWPNLSEYNRFDNERAEHESECWSNHNDDSLKSPWHESAEGLKSNCQISAGKLNLEDTNNTEVNISVEDIFCNTQTNFVEQNKVDFENKNVHCTGDDLSDLEAYHSLDTSFCEEFRTDNFTKILDVDEEYWTDFDDEYESLQASFAEEYKSLDTTVDDEHDEINNSMMDAPNNSRKLIYYESFDIPTVSKSDELFSSIKTKKLDGFLPFEQGYETNVYEFNSLENSVDESEETYDVDNYENLIVDEDERSEPLVSAGHAIQEFLILLESVKHLPIQTQNVAVLHYISKFKELSWQSQMQSRI